ncbi:hypothetical protein [Spiroplasma endosymbiont of Nebria brevicollis]|uniref:hypothetical protein n=1 Tax=Spiroplasma endosymbiont of Nebria brevicollis TaxID=3066284 RepID=UPI00313E2A93
MAGISERLFSIDVADDGTVYVGTNKGVYMSNGTAVFTKMAGISERLFSIDVADDGTVYVGTNKGVYMSNGTAVFTIMSNKSLNNQKINSVVVFKNTIYLTTISKVYKLTLPNTFTEISGITDNISSNATLKGALYVGTSATEFTGSVYKKN